MTSAAEEVEEELDLNCDEVLSDPEPEHEMHPMTGHDTTDRMFSLRAELASAVTAEPDEACFSGRSPLPPSAGYAPHYNGMNGLIPEETIMVFNINDRQVRLDLEHEDSSLYTYIRRWVCNDPECIDSQPVLHLPMHPALPPPDTLECLPPLPEPVPLCRDGDKAPGREVLAEELAERTRGVRAHATKQHKLKVARFKARMRMLLPPSTGADEPPTEEPPLASANLPPLSSTL